MDSIAGPVTIGGIVGAAVLVGFLSAIVSHLTNFFKQLIPKKLKEKTDFQFPIIMSIVIGVALGLTVRIDILRRLGFTVFYPYVSYILTGLMAATGSSGWHEFLRKARASRKYIEELLKGLLGNQDNIDN
ncbi:MAG: hypothetical protein WBH77_09880 [Saccharofermentanales bacterium]